MGTESNKNRLNSRTESKKDWNDNSFFEMTE